MIYKTLVPQHGIEPRSALYKRAATPISYKGVTLVDPQGIEPCKAGLKVRNSGVCAAESLLLRTRPDGTFSLIIFVTYEQLCASNDHKNVLAMARSRYAEFYRADSRSKTS